MLTVNRELLESMFYELVKTPGTSGTVEENMSTETIVKQFKAMPYFQENPEYVKCHPISGDGFDRQVITALVKGNGKSNKNHYFNGPYGRGGRKRLRKKSGRGL